MEMENETEMYCIGRDEFFIFVLVYF